MPDLSAAKARALERGPVPESIYYREGVSTAYRTPIGTHTLGHHYLYHTWGVSQQELYDQGFQAMMEEIAIELAENEANNSRFSGYDDDDDDDDRIAELEEELKELRNDLRGSQSLVAELEEELEIFGGVLQANDARRFLPRHGRNWGGPSSR